MSVLELPQNMCQAQEVHVEVHDKTKGTLKDSIKLCLNRLPSKRVLIVVFSEIISSDLIDLIEEIRGDRRPLVVDKRSKLGKNPKDINENEIIIRKWLVNQAKKQDLIASSSVIAGFEWSSVLMMTSNNHECQFSLRNMVMRAMCRLVWLKTNSLDEVHEVPPPF